MRKIRTVFAGVVSIVAYFAYRIFIERLLSFAGDNYFLTFISFIIDSGAGAFLAFLLAGVIASREYRFILFGVLLFLLYSFLIVSFFPLSTEFGLLLGNVFNLSFGAICAFLGIACTVNIGKVKLPKSRVSAERSISGFLTGASLVSIPIVYLIIILSSFITAGACIWLFIIVFQLPRIPVFLIIALGGAPLIAGWAAIKGIIVIFKNNPNSVNAVRIDMATSPSLSAIVDDVCARLGTSKPDYVMLHAEPTFFVTQSKINTLDGATCFGKNLAIGAPLLYELTTPELRSILAHEFAHFTGKDTLYSNRILPVYKSISSVLEDLRGYAGGSILTATINFLLRIPQMCVLTFVNFFASIDNLLSRKRELRADSISAEHFGAASFRSALRKVVELSAYYYQNVMDMKPSGQFFVYVHDLAIAARESVEKAFTEVMKQEESVFDSHPTFAARMEHLPNIDKWNPDEPQMTAIIGELTPLLEQLSVKYTEYLDKVKELIRAYNG